MYHVATAIGITAKASLHQHKLTFYMYTQFAADNIARTYRQLTVEARLQ